VKWYWEWVNAGCVVLVTGDGTKAAYVNRTGPSLNLSAQRFIVNGLLVERREEFASLDEAMRAVERLAWRRWPHGYTPESAGPALG